MGLTPLIEQFKKDENKIEKRFGYNYITLTKYLLRFNSIFIFKCKNICLLYFVPCNPLSSTEGCREPSVLGTLWKYNVILNTVPEAGSWGSCQVYTGLGGTTCLRYSVNKNAVLWTWLFSIQYHVFLFKPGFHSFHSV